MNSSSMYPLHELNNEMQFKPKKNHETNDEDVNLYPFQSILRTYIHTLSPPSLE